MGSFKLSASHPSVHAQNPSETTRKSKASIAIHPRPKQTIPDWDLISFGNR